MKINIKLFVCNKLMAGLETENNQRVTQPVVPKKAYIHYKTYFELHFVTTAEII